MKALLARSLSPATEKRLPQWLLLAAGLAGAACEWLDPSEKPAPSAVPIDRLKPEEPGSAEARSLGFKPPKGMSLDARFPKEVHLIGTTAQQEVVDELRRQVAVTHVELEGGQIVFPRATLKGGDPTRIFRVLVSRSHGQTRVVIRDETRAPAPPGLSVVERLKQAGLGPDGKQLERQSGH